MNIIATDGYAEHDQMSHELMLRPLLLRPDDDGFKVYEGWIAGARVIDAIARRHEVDMPHCG